MLSILEAAKAKRALVIFPIAFVSEHSETLVELDIEYRHLADKNGAAAYVRVPAVATHPAFIAGLADAGEDGAGAGCGGAGRQRTGRLRRLAALRVQGGCGMMALALNWSGARCSPLPRAGGGLGWGRCFSSAQSSLEGTTLAPTLPQLGGGRRWWVRTSGEFGAL